MVGVGFGSWGKGILEKSLLGQERRELFRKMRKVYIEIFNIHYTFKVSELIAWTFRKTNMANCNFPGTSYNGSGHGDTSLIINISF